MGEQHDAQTADVDGQAQVADAAAQEPHAAASGPPPEHPGGGAWRRMSSRLQQMGPHAKLAWRLVVGLGVVIGIVAASLQVRDSLEAKPSAAGPAVPATVTATVIPPGLAGSEAACAQQLGGKTLDETAPRVTLCVSARAAQEKFTADTSTSPLQLVAIRAMVHNTGSTQLDNVVVRAVLPDSLTLVPGTTALYLPSRIDGSPLTGPITGQGINVGSYSKGALSFVLFYIRAAAPEQFTCGPNRDGVKVVVETDYGQRTGSSVITTTRHC